MATPPRAKRLTLLAATAVVSVFAVVGWIYRHEIRERYLLWQDFKSLGTNEQGYREYRHRQTGIVMVSLPGGAFTMGSPEDEEGAAPREHPRHEVTLSSFLIAKYEVTQEQWRTVMGTDPSHFKGSNLPVEKVSWDDCRAFCEKIGLSLPTEAQREYACRAGTNGPYGGSGKLDEMGWYRDNSGKKTHPIRQKQPNAFGLYDMHGNVHEWCLDWYGSYDLEVAARTGERKVPIESARNRIFRGGSFASYARYARSADRSSLTPSSIGISIGLRPSRIISE